MDEQRMCEGKITIALKAFKSVSLQVTKPAQWQVGQPRLRPCEDEHHRSISGWGRSSSLWSWCASMAR